jgi:hypothetical protein
MAGEAAVEGGVERCGGDGIIEQRKMKVRRYQVRGEIVIEAPIDRVYAIAADPALVPSYAAEVVRIERVKSFSERVVLVKSHLRIAKLTMSFLYRYHYVPPTHYSGVQQAGLFRGYFTFTFSPQGGGTIVSHTEGIFSRFPGLAWLVGFIYLRVLARGGMTEELAKLKALVENSTSQPSAHLPRNSKKRSSLPSRPQIRETRNEQRKIASSRPPNFPLPLARGGPA